MIKEGLNPREVVNFDRIKDKIISPEDFDKSYAGDGEFRERVTAFNTFSLTHLAYCVSGDRFSVKRYPKGFARGSIFFALPPQVYPELFPYGTQVPETPMSNRDYGANWVVNEVYQELRAGGSLYPELENALACFFYPSSTDLRRSLLYNPHLSAVPLLQHLEFEPVGGPRLGSAFKAIIDHFGSGQEFIHYLRIVNQRGGVQFVYGDRPKFLEFVESLPDNKYGEGMDLELKVDVPGDLVTHIIPLGAYEQRILLKSQ